MALEQHKRGKIEILAISLVCGNTTINYQKINILRILKLFPDSYGKVKKSRMMEFIRVTLQANYFVVSNQNV